MSTTTVDPDDVRTLLDHVDHRGGRRTAATAAAIDALRAAIEPSLFSAAPTDLAVVPPPLSDPAAPSVQPVHRDALDTERAARYAAMPKAGSTRLRVLRAIAAGGLAGRTDQELELVLGLGRPTPGNRRNELVAGGWVRDSGDRRPTVAGNPAIVWVLTDRGAARMIAARLADAGAVA